MKPWRLRFSWKRDKKRRFGRQSFSLNYGGIRYATVASIGSGWYWYGLGRNTAENPLPTYEAAQAQCMEFAKTKLDELKERFGEKR